MADWRYFEPAFWSEEDIERMSFEEKSFYIYLFTNEHCNQAGVYKVSKNKIAFETGLDEERVGKLLEKFVVDEKVEILDGLIWVKNFLKHQPNQNPSVWRRIGKDVKRMEMYSPGLTMKYLEHVKNLPIPCPEDVDTLLTPCPQGVNTIIRKGKGKGKGKGKPSCPKLKITDEDMKLVEALEAKIRDIDANHRFPGGRYKDRWANTFRLMRERDNRTIQDIRSVLDFAFQDSFWSAVVQSANNLRDNYNKIRAKMLKSRTDSEDNAKYQVILNQAKEDLGRLGGKDRILKWLLRLPERYHGEIKRFLDRKYRDGHSYGEAKDEWQKGIRGP